MGGKVVPAPVSRCQVPTATCSLTTEATLKTTLDTARHFMPKGTDSGVAHAYNRAALAAVVAAKASALGFDSSMSNSQMAGLAQLVRDDKRVRPLSPETRAAIRAALRPALTVTDDPEFVRDAVFAHLADTPLRVRGSDNREYLLIAVPVN